MKRVWAIMVIAVTVGTAAFGQEMAAPKKYSAFSGNAAAHGYSCHTGFFRLAFSIFLLYGN
jgi:steroid 5-alpha reductase family enzyme